MRILLSRRQAVTALGLTAGLAGTASILEGARRPLVMRDINLGAAHDRRIAALTGQEDSLPLLADPVRQWRDGLRAEVERAGGAIMLARWNKAHMLCGLARESGMRAEMTRIDGAIFRVGMKA